MSDSLTAWLALDSVRGLGPSRFHRLLEHYGDPAVVFEQSAQELLTRAGLEPKIVEGIKSTAPFECAADQLERAHAHGVEIVRFCDPNYPSLLANIPIPPPLLYMQGTLEPTTRPCLGVVGTRQPTIYGRNATAALVEELVGAGVTIISGLANGIDTVAHEVCIEQGGCTIAVLGCGIDIQLSISRRELAGKIVQKGALISEFPLGMRAEPHNFPRRNRIISGLSSGVLVVEAGRKSGALITANYALAQGRDVFAVPGSVFSDKSSGTFDLIKSGATPVQSAQNILEQIRFDQPLKAPASAPGTLLTAAFPFEQLNKQEQHLFKILTPGGLRLDQLSDQTGLSLSELFDIVLNLELKGVIRQQPGQVYEVA